MCIVSCARAYQYVYMTPGTVPVVGNSRMGFMGNRFAGCARSVGILCVEVGWKKAYFVFGTALWLGFCRWGSIEHQLFFSSFVIS